MWHSTVIDINASMLLLHEILSIIKISLQDFSLLFIHCNIWLENKDVINA